MGSEEKADIPDYSEVVFFLIKAVFRRTKLKSSTPATSPQDGTREQSKDNFLAGSCPQRMTTIEKITAMKDHSIKSGRQFSVPPARIIQSPYERIASFKGGIFNFSFQQSIQWMEEKGKLFSLTHDETIFASNHLKALS